MLPLRNLISRPRLRRRLGLGSLLAGIVALCLFPRGALRGHFGLFVRVFLLGLLCSGLGGRFQCLLIGDLPFWCCVAFISFEGWRRKEGWVCEISVLLALVGILWIHLILLLKKVNWKIICPSIRYTHHGCFWKALVRNRKSSWF